MSIRNVGIAGWRSSRVILRQGFALQCFYFCRDNISTSDPDIEYRRKLFEDIFARLESAGLQILLWPSCVCTIWQGCSDYDDVLLLQIYGHVLLISLRIR